MSDFLLIFGIIAVVLTVTAILSNVVERSVLSFPLMFLGFGFAIGEGGLGLLELGSHDPMLEVVGTLTLALVLFLDATKLQLEELGKRWLVPALILGPGTAIIIVLGALPLHYMLGFGWVVAIAGGAILASTDPVVLREILSDSRIPRSVKQILHIEAGMNDIVVLPVVLILIAVALNEVGGLSGWVVFSAKLLIIGPAIGFVIGGAGSWCLAQIDKKMPVKREYQALYGIGLVLASYSAATAVGGDGFLSAFAAGLAVIVLNQTLCDCFLEYGEVTAEMAMLLTFVLFGAVLSGIIGDADIVPAVVLGVLVIFAIRPVVLGAVLSRARMSWEAHAFVAWFGPRGLNSLLLALLLVHAGVPGAELLLATVGIVVLLSVTIHGASATPITAWYGRKAKEDTLVEERETTAAGLFEPVQGGVGRMTPEELSELMKSSNPPLVLDVRSRSSYANDGGQIPGGVRVLPDEVATWAKNNYTDRLIVAYCT